tara:strand:+ start:909 stop:1880 length:972 start_codon:yes stop_codon:yes gene_type:complete
MIRLLSYIGLLIGILILTLLIFWQGFTEIFGLLFKSGFSLLFLPLVWMPSLIVAVISWRQLFPNKIVPPFKELFLALWIGRAINTILPVATIGGEIAKARLLIFWGKPVINVSASVLVDKTVQALALIPWAIIGISLLIYLAVDNKLAMLLMLCTVILGLGIAGFIFFQRTGIFSFFAKIIGKFHTTDSWDKITLKASDVDKSVNEIYSNRKKFIVSLLWRTLGLILQTSEVWLACYLLGHPINLIEAIMLKSLTSIITDLAFIIPNGYGVQEGGYLVLGVLIGLTPEFSLALSLATRVRELIIDIPGLLYWQHIEVKHFSRK